MRPSPIRNPHAIRPWQHVLEPLCGYLLLAERLHANAARFGEAWNFGPADEDARPVGMAGVAHRAAMGQWRDMVRRIERCAA